MVVATLLGELLKQVFSPTTVLTVYLLCVLLSAILWGQGPSILVSFLGVLAFDFFFVPPAYTFRVEDTQYVITFAALLLVGVIIGYLTTRIRRQTAGSPRTRAPDGRSLCPGARSWRSRTDWILTWTR